LIEKSLICLSLSLDFLIETALFARQSRNGSVMIGNGDERSWTASLARRRRAVNRASSSLRHQRVDNLPGEIVPFLNFLDALLPMRRLQNGQQRRRKDLQKHPRGEEEKEHLLPR
jgi:hypothetical protein